MTKAASGAGVADRVAGGPLVFRQLGVLEAQRLRDDRVLPVEVRERGGD
jgi:hypothetical protein